MGLPFKNLLAVSALTVASLGVVSTIITQAAPANAQTEPGESLQEQFNQAFYQNDKPFWQNRSPLRQLDFLLGKGLLLRNSFPENEITRDGRAIHNLYVDAMYQQGSTGPVIRTPDLPNPYNSSIFTLPTSNFNPRPAGSELNFQFPLQP